MEITVSHKQSRIPITVMSVTGSVDSSNYHEFTLAIKAAVLKGTQYLLIDFSGCNYISSAGIRSLNEAHLLFKKTYPEAEPKNAPRSARIKLLNPSGRVADALAISGVDAFFEIHTDLDAALASF